jgi:hypothetical protein
MTFSYLIADAMLDKVLSPPLRRAWLDAATAPQVGAAQAT